MTKWIPKFALFKLTKLQTNYNNFCLFPKKIKNKQTKVLIEIFLSKWQICSNLQPSWYWPMLITNRLMRCQWRLSFTLPLPTSSSTPSSTSLAAIDHESVAVHEIGHLLGQGHSLVVVALDQYALEAIVVSIFTLVSAIYSFVTAKKKVTGEAWTEAVNYIAADADVIIVSAGNAGSALAHTLGKVRQILHFFFSSFFLDSQTVH